MRTLATLALVALFLAETAAQAGNSTWLSWARANHHPIASVQPVAGDTFADLQFMKATLKDRRIVQLGESGHGVAQFNHAKVRLIQFLHEQMGFDVIAFESGLFECYNANQSASVALAMMRSCIFGVWHTQEVLPLFEYIKDRQQTDRPLTLAGFDSQLSSSQGASSRPAFFANLVRMVDAPRANTVQTTDQEFLQGLTTSSAAAYATANEPRLTEFYGGLEQFFQEHRDRLNEAAGGRQARVAERAAWSMLRYLEQLRAGLARPRDQTSDESGGAIRDFAMANNLTFLANELYAGRKIIVWAHNFHIRHDNAATTSRQPTMGQWIRERFRSELYTIGLYMDTGTAAQNNRAVYSITRGRPDSMEWVMANAGPAALFMDFLGQAPVAGNRWMFEPTVQREWGTNSFTMVPRDQYDGVLFIDAVTPPAYIGF